MLGIKLERVRIKKPLITRFLNQGALDNLSLLHIAQENDSIRLKAVVTFVDDAITTKDTINAIILTEPVEIDGQVLRSRKVIFE